MNKKYCWEGQKKKIQGHTQYVVVDGYLHEKKPRIIHIGPRLQCTYECDIYFIAESFLNYMLESHSKENIYHEAEGGLLSETGHFIATL